MEALPLFDYAVVCLGYGQETLVDCPLGLVWLYAFFVSYLLMYQPDLWLEPVLNLT